MEPPHSGTSTPTEPDEASPADRFDLSTFDQAEIWIDRIGGEHPIAAMGSSERLELRGWLLAHARHFYLHVLTRDLFVYWPGGLRDLPDRAPELLYLSAEQWMLTTPLYTSLNS